MNRSAFLALAGRRRQKPAETACEPERVKCPAQLVPRLITTVRLRYAKLSRSVAKPL